MAVVFDVLWIHTPLPLASKMEGRCDSFLWYTPLHGRVQGEVSTKRDIATLRGSRFYEKSTCWAARYSCRLHLSIILSCVLPALTYLVPVSFYRDYLPIRAGCDLLLRWTRAHDLRTIGRALQSWPTQSISGLGCLLDTSMVRAGHHGAGPGARGHTRRGKTEIESDSTGHQNVLDITDHLCVRSRPMLSMTA